MTTDNSAGATRTKLRGADNFLQFKRELRRDAEAEGVWEIITGTADEVTEPVEPTPPPDAPPTTSAQDWDDFTLEALRRKAAAMPQAADLAKHNTKADLVTALTALTISASNSDEKEQKRLDRNYDNAIKTYNVKFAKWERYEKKTRKAMKMIMDSVDSHYLGTLSSFKTPNEAWTYICQQFKMQDVKALEIAYSKIEKLNVTMCNGIQEYIGQLKNFQQDVKEADGEYNDVQLMSKIIRGLNPAGQAYEGFVRLYYYNLGLPNAAQPTLRSLESSLLTWESNNGLLKANKKAVTAVEGQSISNKGNSNAGGSGGNKKGKKREKICTFSDCKAPYSHKVDNCFFKHPEKAPADWAKKAEKTAEVKTEVAVVDATGAKKQKRVIIASIEVNDEAYGELEKSMEANKVMVEDVVDEEFVKDHEEEVEVEAAKAAIAEPDETFSDPPCDSTQANSDNEEEPDGDELISFELPEVKTTGPFIFQWAYQLASLLATPDPEVRNILGWQVTTLPRGNLHFCPQGLHQPTYRCFEGKHTRTHSRRELTVRNAALDVLKALACYLIFALLLVRPDLATCLLIGAGTTATFLKCRARYVRWRDKRDDRRRSRYIARLAEARLHHKCATHYDCSHNWRRKVGRELARAKAYSASGIDAPPRITKKDPWDPTPQVCAVGNLVEAGGDDLLVKKKDAWIVDSGANSHVTNNDKWYTKFWRGKSVAATANDSNGMSLTGHGTVSLNIPESSELVETDLNIGGVLLAKGARFNILSLPKLDIAGLRGEWGNREVTFRTQDGELFARAPLKEDGLYHMPVDIPMPSINSVEVKTEAEVAAISLQEKVWLWHRRLGHLGLENMRKLLKKSSGIPLTDKEIKAKLGAICPICQVSHITNTIPHDTSSRRYKEAGELMTVDLWGPHKNPPGYDGTKYFLVFVDAATRYTWVVALREQIQAIPAMKRMHKQIQRAHGFTIRNYRFDDFFFNNGTVKTWASTKGVGLEPSTPRAHHQMGLNERVHRTIREKSQAMIIDRNLPDGLNDVVEAAENAIHEKKLPASLWPEAFRHAVWMKNRTPHRALRSRTLTPWKALFKTQPDLSGERVWGSIAYVPVSNEVKRSTRGGKQPSKLLNAYGWWGYFVGRENEGTWRVYNPQAKDITVQRVAMIRVDDGDTTEVDDTQSSRESQQPNHAPLPANNTHPVQQQSPTLIDSDDDEAASDDDEAAPVKSKFFSVIVASVETKSKYFQSDPGLPSDMDEPPQKKAKTSLGKRSMKASCVNCWVNNIDCTWDFKKAPPSRAEQRKNASCNNCTLNNLDCHKFDIPKDSPKCRPCSVNKQPCDRDHPHEGANVPCSYCQRKGTSCDSVQKKKKPRSRDKLETHMEAHLRCQRCTRERRRCYRKSPDETCDFCIERNGICIPASEEDVAFGEKGKKRSADGGRSYRETGRMYQSDFEKCLRCHRRERRCGPERPCKTCIDAKVGYACTEQNPGPKCQNCIREGLRCNRQSPCASCQKGYERGVMRGLKSCTYRDPKDNQREIRLPLRKPEDYGPRSQFREASDYCLSCNYYNSKNTAKRFCDGKSPCWHCMNEGGYETPRCTYVLPDRSVLCYNKPQDHPMRTIPGEDDSGEDVEDDGGEDAAAKLDKLLADADSRRAAKAAEDRARQARLAADAAAGYSGVSMTLIDFESDDDDAPIDDEDDAPIDDEEDNAKESDSEDDEDIPSTRRRQVFIDMERTTSDWVRNPVDYDPSAVVASFEATQPGFFSANFDDLDSDSDGDLDDDISLFGADDTHSTPEATSDADSSDSTAGSSDSEESDEESDAPASAVDKYQAAFPYGHMVLSTPSDGLLCGFNAIIKSMESQYPELPRPTLPDLKNIVESPTWLATAAEFCAEDLDMGNVNNFTVDQVALALHEWAASHSLAIQMGVRIEGGATYLLPSPVSNADDLKLLWIHNDNKASATSFGHYSGLMKLPSVPEITNIWVKGGNSVSINALMSMPDRNDEGTPHLDTQAPRTYREAMMGDEAAHWKAATDSEFESIKANEVCVAIPRSEVPAGRRILTARWVFKKKPGANNEVVRYKARWVARGFQQIYGEDFDQTYASVIKGASYKVLLAIAAMLNLTCHLMDVKTAFLNGLLEEDIYIFPPEGYEDQYPPGYVLKLVKSLYGLKQSPRQWYKRLKDVFVSHGWSVSAYDEAIFYDGKGAIVAAYVDDLMILAPKLEQVNKVKTMLTDEFSMSDLGECQLYLGMIIERSEEAIKMHHRRYIEEILDRFDLHNVRRYATPMEAGTKLMVDKNPGAQACDKTLYQEMVGCLNYLATTIRFDIANATSIVSRFTSSPNELHMAAVKRIYGYLSTTKDFGLIFKTGSSEGLHALSDSDWGGCPDTFRSTTGFMVRLAGAPVSWMSKRQASTAQSTCEAEYIAAAEATKEVVWMRNLITELGIKLNGATVLHMDNEAAKKLAHNPEFHARTKHIALRYHLLREQTLEGVIDPQYIPTADNLADMLTKPLPRPAFESLRDRASPGPRQHHEDRTVPYGSDG